MRWGIANARVAEAFGQVISYWWHVEEQFLHLLDDLLTGQKAAQYTTELNARLIFRTLISQKSRIEIMKSLLETMPHNADKPAIYDELIGEFSALNAIRNNYVHGMWQTSLADMKVYLKRSGSIHEVFERPTEVTREDLLVVLTRMQKLFERIALRDGRPS